MTRRRRRGGFNPLATLSEADIRDQFDAKTFMKGDEYQRQCRVSGLVLDLDPDSPRLAGTVRGSGSNVYHVTVDLIPVEDAFVCEGYCGCPLVVDCKHVVATLLEAVRSGVIPAETPDKADESVPTLMSYVRHPPVSPSSAAKNSLAGPLDSWLNAMVASLRPAVAAPQLKGTAKAAPKSGPAPEVLLYLFDVLTFPGNVQRTALNVVVVRPLKAGGWGSPRPTDMASVARSSARHVADADRAIARLVLGNGYAPMPGWPADAPADLLDWCMERILATGRACWQSKDGVRLTRGPDRDGQLDWVLTPSGDQKLVPVAREAGLVVLPGRACFAVDPASGAMGRLNLPLEPAIRDQLLAAPPVPPEMAAAFAGQLRERLPGLEIALPRTDVVVVEDKAPPVPVLRIGRRPLTSPAWGWGKREKEQWIDAVWLTFDYDGNEIEPDSDFEQSRRVEGNRVIVSRRKIKAERAAIARLGEAGLAHASQVGDYRWKLTLGRNGFTFPVKQASRTSDLFEPEDPLALIAFLHERVPGLAADGWRVILEDGVSRDILTADAEISADIEDKSGWWFALDLGIEVEGERIALLPVLLSALSRLKPGDSPETLARNGTFYASLPDGRILAIGYDRVAGLIGALVELFDGRPSSGSMEISLAEAISIDAIAPQLRLRWVGGHRLQKLANRLGPDGIRDMDREVPTGFAADLRPYQQTGFAWMGFIAEEGLGGVLADDMGLGKTVQSLAHILAEKTSGRMSAPVLVVCPTSLVAVWREEAARFAPGLAVTVMHGLNRPRSADAFVGADLVISTYPLLPRDGDLLEAVDWHAVILDEAQAIKNPAAQWTRVACRLKAGHRLCLTGTPVENHLGEAWSLFTFLMPGLLGDAKDFTRRFRTPIEKKQDGGRRQLLARRLKPFLLRRTKGQVAAELPAKTEIVHRVDLSGAQRDLYETLRLAMNDKVRASVAAKGLARSAIIILDALLKLRQACCDPRLVKLQTAARAGAASAKLDHLMELLPTLVEDGRRILLFSQFTSMLDLIRPELDRAGIGYVELTGDTTDRATPVKAFQNGKVPLFLISLKAGGTGLTLTAADTVIHYDPWWNPAVEDQATDRAHRIGQDKPVFVYKLIAAGTVEERMLEMQARKRDVAASLFNPDATAPLTFTEDDLAALFQPVG